MLCVLASVWCFRAASAFEAGYFAPDASGLPQDVQTIIVVGDAVASRPGALVTVDVGLDSPAEQAAGVQNDILFPPGLRVVACARNPAIGKDATAFSFRPAGCRLQGTCERVSVLVLSLLDTSPIPHGALLYSCTAEVDDDAEPGSVLPLLCLNPDASTGQGEALPAACVDGAVYVDDAPCAGDCDGDGRVTVNELITGIGLALGNDPVAICAAFDEDGNGAVSIDEVVTAINRALFGC